MDVASIVALLEVATKLNGVLKNIKAQGEVDNPEVWNEVRQNHRAAVAAFEKSIAKDEL